jgi:phosphoserine aminotransferase
MNKLPNNPKNELNFSGGPGVLPEKVLQQVQESIIAVPEIGLSILGISHRSDWFASVVDELEQNIRQLLGLPNNYHVLFLQGGATQQFSMIPMALLRNKKTAAEYIHSGYWSSKSIHEAQREGPVRVLWDGQSSGFSRLPSDEELDFNPQAPYLHYVTNETVEGLQFHRLLGRDDVPRICDMSSDFLSAPGDFEKVSMIYAHAQKNIGPAGVTVVILHDDLLPVAPSNFPGFLDYRTQIAAHSIYNTPPVFAIYVVLLVTRWLIDDVGGLSAMDKINSEKAQLLYQELDENHTFFLTKAEKKDRSKMNVVFKLQNTALEYEFINEALSAGFSGLTGHRSIGGIRASLYNGMPRSSVEKLLNFMSDFRIAHS